MGPVHDRFSVPAVVLREGVASKETFPKGDEGLQAGGFLAGKCHCQQSTDLSMSSMFHSVLQAPWGASGMGRFSTRSTVEAHQRCLPLGPCPAAAARECLGPCEIATTASDNMKGKQRKDHLRWQRLIWLADMCCNENTQ